MSSIEDKQPAPAAGQTRMRKSLVQTLPDINYGKLLDECDEKLHEALDTSERTGKRTKFTLEIEFVPQKQGTGRYNVIGVAKNKLPAKETEEAFMFVGPDGNLTNKDPRQNDLPGIRAVDGPAPAVRLDDDKPAGFRVG